MPAFQTPAVSEAFDPEPKRESMRGWLALSLVIMLIIEICGAFTIILYKPDIFENMRTLLEIVFGATVTLVGTALGFYFGEKTATSKGANT